MIYLERFGSCRGLRISLPFMKQIEFWYAPSGSVIEPHVHEHTDSTIFYILGKVEAMVNWRYAIAHGFLRKRNSNGRWVLAYRHIPAGQVHGAKILSGFGVFAVWQTCLEQRVSPSVDFKAV